MMYVKKERREAWLLIGFFSMLLCGVSDCLLSYMGEGEPYVLAGMISSHIAEEPLWYYWSSFVIGILASVGYLLASRAACSYIYDRLQGEKTKTYKAYAFGTTMMSIGIFGIHSICCLALMNVRAALLAGASVELISEYFTASALIPFAVGTIWQTTADIIAGVAFIILICKKKVAISKGFIIIGPLVFYVICKVVAAILTQVTGSTMPAHYLGGGESWGIAFMFLAFFTACRKDAAAQA